MNSVPSLSSESNVQAQASQGLSKKACILIAITGVALMALGIVAMVYGVQAGDNGNHLKDLYAQPYNGNGDLTNVLQDGSNPQYWLRFDTAEHLSKYLDLLRTTGFCWAGDIVGVVGGMLAVYSLSVLYKRVSSEKSKTPIDSSKNFEVQRTKVVNDTSPRSSQNSGGGGGGGGGG